MKIAWRLVYRAKKRKPQFLRPSEISYYKIPVNKRTKNSLRINNNNNNNEILKIYNKISPLKKKKKFRLRQLSYCVFCFFFFFFFFFCVGSTRILKFQSVFLEIWRDRDPFYDIRKVFLPIKRPSVVAFLSEYDDGIGQFSPGSKTKTLFSPPNFQYYKIVSAAAAAGRQDGHHTASQILNCRSLIERVRYYYLLLQAVRKTQQTVPTV